LKRWNAALWNCFGWPQDMFKGEDRDDGFALNDLARDLKHNTISPPS
jgi:hypothetical protein